MATTTDFKNLLLDAADVVSLSLHDGAPGAAGTDNEITGGGYARETVTFDAAASAERVLSAAADFTATASQAVTHVGFWATGPTFRGSAAIVGDTAFNASGEFRLTTATKITMADAA